MSVNNVTKDVAVKISFEDGSVRVASTDVFERSATSLHTCDLCLKSHASYRI